MSSDISAGRAATKGGAPATAEAAALLQRWSVNKPIVIAFGLLVGCLAVVGTVVASHEEPATATSSAPVEPFASAAPDLAPSTSTPAKPDPPALPADPVERVRTAVLTTFNTPAEEGRPASAAKQIGQSGETLVVRFGMADNLTSGLRADGPALQVTGVL